MHSPRLNGRCRAARAARAAPPRRLCRRSRRSLAILGTSKQTERIPLLEQGQPRKGAHPGEWFLCQKQFFPTYGVVHMVQMVQMVHMVHMVLMFDIFSIFTIFSTFSMFCIFCILVCLARVTKTRNFVLMRSRQTWQSLESAIKDLINCALPTERNQLTVCD
jgi:hypothetical protein